MRTRAALSGIFASVAILVVGWQAGSAAVTAATATNTIGTHTSSGTSPAASPTPSAPSPTNAATPAAPTATAAGGSFTGSSVSTPYGRVQIQIVVANHKITDVKALHLTDDGGRSVQISNDAAPILRSEVLSSQSAQVSSVSGATYTSDAYLTSLQSALDQAGI